MEQNRYFHYLNKCDFFFIRKLCLKIILSYKRNKSGILQNFKIYKSQNILTLFHYKIMIFLL